MHCSVPTMHCCRRPPPTPLHSKPNRYGLERDAGTHRFGSSPLSHVCAFLNVSRIMDLDNVKQIRILNEYVGASQEIQVLK